MEGVDFFEGVRSKLVERDTPKWQHKNIDEVTDSEVERHFKELAPEKELRI